MMGILKYREDIEPFWVLFNLVSWSNGVLEFWARTSQVHSIIPSLPQSVTPSLRLSINPSIHQPITPFSRALIMTKIHQFKDNE